MSKSAFPTSTSLKTPAPAPLHKKEKQEQTFQIFTCGVYKMTKIAKYFHKYLFNDLNNQMVCPEANYRPENSKNNNRNSLTLPHPSFPFKKTVIKGKCFPTVSFISSLEKKRKNAGRAETNSGKEMYTANKFRSARPPDLVLGTEKAAATAEGEEKTFFSCDRRRGQSLFFPFPYPRPTMAAIFRAKENAPIPKSNPFPLIFGHFSKNTSNIFAVGFSTFCGNTVFLGNFCRNYLQKNWQFLLCMHFAEL